MSFKRLFDESYNLTNSWIRKLVYLSNINLRYLEASDLEK